MSSMRLTVNSSMQGFDHFVQTFPGVKIGFLSRIAEQGRLTLKGMLIGGAGMIKLNEYPRSSGGKRTIGASVKFRASSVKFSSFPVNLFENGRKLRSGRREAPKKIITGKFKSIAGSQLQGWANRAERMVIQQATRNV